MESKKKRQSHLLDGITLRATTVSLLTPFPQNQICTSHAFIISRTFNRPPPSAYYRLLPNIKTQSPLRFSTQTKQLLISSITQPIDSFNHRHSSHPVEASALHPINHRVELHPWPGSTQESCDRSMSLSPANKSFFSFISE